MRTTPTPILTEAAVTRAFSQCNTALATGRRIRWAREQAGLSRQELAEFALMSERTLERVEKGERTLNGRERAAIARGIGTSIGFLTVDSNNGDGRRAA